MDLFEREQKIYEDSFTHLIEVRNGSPINSENFEIITKEYGRLLKHIRMVTKIADKTAIDLHKNNMDLSSKANQDSLTKLFNRRYLEETLPRYIKELSRSESALSIFMLDIDFFKKYNDTYGHSEGDACLQKMAQILMECVSREDDFVARFGGEEFIIVLPHTDEHGAHVTAARILEKTLERNIPHEANEGIGCVTISIGFTTVKVKHNHKSSDFIKCADEALYMSKKNGRNRYTFKKYTEEDE